MLLLVVIILAVIVVIHNRPSRELTQDEQDYIDFLDEEPH